MARPKSNSHRVSLLIDKYLHERIKLFADEADLTVNAWIYMLIGDGSLPRPDDKLWQKQHRYNLGFVKIRKELLLKKIAKANFRRENPNLYLTKKRYWGIRQKPDRVYPPIPESGAGSGGEAMQISASPPPPRFGQ